MGSERIKEWLDRKVALAERLANGESGGGYGDAVLILSSIVSGVAAELWPGEGIDRKRFVEAWSRYSDPSLNPNRVSVPFLVEALRRDDPGAAETVRLLRAGAISEIPQLDGLVVTGDRVDADEREITSVAHVSSEFIRRYSYGNIFYRHFRSGYVHQYKTGTHGDEYIMSTTRGDITYSNWMEPPYRRINFSFAWLAAIGRSVVANAADDYWAGQQAIPNPWWVEG